MPPKQTLAARARGPRTLRTKKTAPLSANTAPAGLNPVTESRPRGGLSLALLGPHNTLKQLLAGPPVDSKTLRATPPRKNGGKLGARLSLSPQNSVNTPMSRLKLATAQLNGTGSPTRLPHFADIESELPPPKKRRPGRPSKQNGSILLALNSTSSTRPRPRPPKIEAFPDDDEGTDFPASPGAVPEFQPPISRRSSYNNRGKRGLSIGNGFVAKPHSEVSEQDYYKHINAAMSEPNRMRQLLAWCFRKTMENEKNEDSGVSNEARTAEGVAKAIERELLADIIDGAISTSWYSLKDEQQDRLDHVPGRTIIRPNPQNEANKENIAVFTEKLRSLRAEKARLLNAYHASVKPVEDLGLDPRAITKEELRVYLREKLPESSFQDSIINEDSSNDVYADVQRARDCVENNLELNVDRLHNLLHRLRQSLGLVSRFKENVLKPEFLDLVHKYVHREDGKNSPSTRDLLRGITKVDRARNLN